jgi:hypothetical protein
MGGGMTWDFGGAVQRTAYTIRWAVLHRLARVFPTLVEAWVAAAERSISRRQRDIVGTHRDEVRLPDGTQVTMPAEWGDLSASDLAVLGIRPAMGNESFVVVAEGNDDDGPRRRRGRG